MYVVAVVRVLYNNHICDEHVALLFSRVRLAPLQDTLLNFSKENFVLWSYKIHEKQRIGSNSRNNHIISININFKIDRLLTLLSIMKYI